MLEGTLLGPAPGRGRGREVIFVFYCPSLPVYQISKVNLSGSVFVPFGRCLGLNAFVHFNSLRIQTSLLYQCIRALCHCEEILKESNLVELRFTLPYSLEGSVCSWLLGPMHWSRTSWWWEHMAEKHLHPRADKEQRGGL